MARPIRLGTRGSLLARTQSELVKSWLDISDGVELVSIKTEGDDLSLSLTKLNEPGVFVTALRSALIKGEVDFIVHSYKDLPAFPDPELELAAIPTREDPRDVLISSDSQPLAALPLGSIVGTSSPRRAASILKLNPEVAVIPIRGNIDSRIKKVRRGEYGAAVLAAAGILRIGYQHEITEYFTVEEMLPAPAQGALAIECRKDDLAMIERLRLIDDPIARLTTTAERAVLQGLNAGCGLAIGAFAKYQDGVLRLIAEIGDSQSGEQNRIENSQIMDDISDVESAEQLGLNIARQFMVDEFTLRILHRDN